MSVISGLCIERVVIEDLFANNKIFWGAKTKTQPTRIRAENESSEPLSVRGPDFFQTQVVCEKRCAAAKAACGAGGGEGWDDRA